MRPRWTIERWIAIATLIVSVGAFVFSLGVNYAQYSQLRSDFDKHVEAEQRRQVEYMRQAEASIQFQQLNDRVSEIHKSMDELTKLLLTERVRNSR